MANPDTSTNFAPSDNTNGANAPKASDPNAAFREMLDALNRSLPAVRGRDPDLAQTIQTITTQAADPLRANQREFRHDVAYAVQDTEKALGHELRLSQNGRSEVARLAGSAPGLENDRMLALLRRTAEIGDPKLVYDLRRTGAEIGRQLDQNADATRSQIEALEDRARKAPEAPNLLPPPAEQPSPSASTNGPAGEQNQAGRASQAAGQTQQQQAPGSRYGTAAPAVYQPGIIDGLILGLRDALAPRGQAPSEPPPQPFGDRLAEFTAKMQAKQDDAGLLKAEKAGRAAADALEGFRTGEGATVMNRIQSAARSDPQGIQGVLSEMREGGKFQDLREQFNNALKDEAGAGRAYDRAAEALAKYGEARTGVEQIIARRPDAANLTTKFQQMDAEIGEAAESTPSRKDGKTMLDDMAKQTAEIFRRAIEGLKSIFTRAGPQAGQSGPSPS